MSYLQLLLAILQLVSQLLKWMDKAEKNDIQAKIDKLIKFDMALKEAEQGKVEPLEEMFAIMRPGTMD